MRITIGFLLFILLISSCTYHELSPCETNVPTFSDCVNPIFTEHCIACHFHNNPDGIMPLTNYEEIQEKVVNGKIIESINKVVGFMPKNGEKLSAVEIIIIEQWYANGTPNN